LSSPELGVLTPPAQELTPSSIGIGHPCGFRLFTTRFSSRFSRFFGEPSYRAFGPPRPYRRLLLIRSEPIKDLGASDLPDAAGQLHERMLLVL
jgi:hypothetical protein